MGTLLLEFMAGIVLGVIYFGGLWLTVRNLGKTRNPAFIVMSSFVIRTLLIVAALYAITSARWDHLVAAVAGFIVSRVILTRYLAVPNPRTGEK
jgi:F1F0 ATPase subunit 2